MISRIFRWRQSATVGRRSPLGQAASVATTYVALYSKPGIPFAPTHGYPARGSAQPSPLARGSGSFWLCFAEATPTHRCDWLCFSAHSSVKLADSMAPSGSGLREKSSPFFRFPFPSRSASVLAQKGHRRRSRAPYRLRRERAAISVAAQGDVVGCRQSAGNCCHRSPTRKPRQGSQSSTPSDRTFHTWAHSRSRALRLSQSD